MIFHCDFLQLQWKWDTYPICFLPKSLRGSEIINLDIGGLHTCLDYTSDEEQNAASTSYNFLEHGECVDDAIKYYSNTKCQFKSIHFHRWS